MSLILFDIPDIETGLIEWLEEKLFDPNLAQLILELEVVHGIFDSQKTLGDILGAESDTVLDNGLKHLPRESLQHLLENPQLLRELRDLILIAGGEYWNRVGTKPFQAIGNRVAQRVKSQLDSLTIPLAENLPPKKHSRRWGYPLTAIASAVCVLVALYFCGVFRPTQPIEKDPVPVVVASWGFSKISQLPQKEKDTETLEALADLAIEWRKKRPETATELAQRLLEFRRGCAELQLNTLPLNAENSQWLKLRCSDWAFAIDQHLRTLEETANVNQVRNAVDQTVEIIERELRQKAKQKGI